MIKKATRRKRIVTDRDWLIGHLSPLMIAGNDLYLRSDSLPVKYPTYDKGYWTGLKLILLKYYIKPYLDVLGKQGYKLGYVDLFAGPGLNRLGDKKIPIPGSPFVPITITESVHQFSAFIYSDINDSYITALSKRICLFPSIENNTKILQMDANDVIPNLPSILSEYNINHCLVFIDPEGMELKWISLEKLKDVGCDLIINFPSSGLRRNLNNPKVIPKIKEFLGPGSENIPNNANEEWAIKVYRMNLANIGKDISTEIIVKSGDSFHYHLIPAVKKTPGGSPWFKAFQYAKERIEKFNGSILGVIAEQIEGRMGSLTDILT